MPPDRVRGILRRVTAKLPGGGEQRPGQVAMAEAVDDAIASRRHLVAQAGTGTGKSLAYLVPAALSGRPVVVATATKALQDQLAERDLPVIAEVVGGGFSYAVLKGRANYLCRQRAAELGERGFQAELEAVGEQGGGPPGTLVDQVERLLLWAQRTSTGDRADLAFEPGPRAWGMVSVGPRECPGAYRCPSGTRCLAEAAREAAARADVVIVNTHLYGAHLASQGTVLPPHDVVVFDEAHQLQDVLTAALGTELTAARLRGLVISSRPLLGDEARAHGGARGLGDREARVLDTLGNLADRLHDRLGERCGRRVLESTAAIGSYDQELPRLLQRSAEVVADLLGALVDRAASASPGEEGGRALRAVTMATHVAEDLALILGAGEKEVAWVDGTPRAPVLRLSPIDIGLTLRPLWEEVTAVFTSATIPPRLGHDLALPEARYRQLDVGSPFEFARRSMLYVAERLPDPRRPEAEAALHDELEALVRAAGGRTLALFTSHRALHAATDALRPRLALRVWHQDDLPKARLLRAFADEETSCLFATLGYWQGIDVPGPSLSLVTLDRIPFPRPDDPLVQARRERAGPGAFHTVDVPRAATLLAQGAGRLIRTSSDTGVVAVLDPRLATARYRGELLAPLPPMRRSTDRALVEEFLANALAPALRSAHPESAGQPGVPGRSRGASPPRAAAQPSERRSRLVSGSEGDPQA